MHRNILLLGLCCLSGCGLGGWLAMSAQQAKFDAAGPVRSTAPEDVALYGTVYRLRRPAELYQWRSSQVRLGDPLLVVAPANPQRPGSYSGQTGPELLAALPVGTTLVLSEVRWREHVELGGIRSAVFRLQGGKYAGEDINGRELLSADGKPNADLLDRVSLGQGAG